MTVAHRTRAGVLATIAILVSCAERSASDAAPGESANAVAPSLSTPPTSADWSISDTSAGPLRIGMTILDINARLGLALKPTYEISDECDMLTIPGIPVRLMIMLHRDTLVRFDVSDTTGTAREGGRVGELEADVLRRYGARARVEPHKYEGPEGHYLVVRSAIDSMYALIFETDGVRITRFRAGRRPEVELIEGCS